MRSRTSEPGSIAQKRARSKSGPSGGTDTLKRVTLTVPLRRPIDTSCAAGGGILNDFGEAWGYPQAYEGGRALFFLESFFAGAGAGSFLGSTSAGLAPAFSSVFASAF